MTVLETQGRLLIIDCGVLFPEDHHPGIDLILPDFEYLDGRLDQVEAIVLTHGHEDHIGAVPFLLKRKPDIPIIGSQLTLALLEAKLKEHRITPYALTVKEGTREKLGVFDLEFVAVNHSIPDALAVMVRTRGRHPPAHRRLQDGPAAAGRPADRPAGVRAARGGGRRPLPHRLDQRRGRRASRRPSARSRRPSTGCSGTPKRRIIVACFSLPRAPRPAGARRGARSPAARSPWSAGRWCATWASPPSSATCTSRTASSSTSRSWTTSRTTRSSSSARVPRASRWPRSPGWPTATTASRSASATRCCWPARSSPATRTRSTASSTG